MDLGESTDERIYKEISKLTAEVIKQRKSFPQKIMKNYEKKVKHEIAQLVNARTELKNELENMQVASTCDELKKSFLTHSSVNENTIFYRLQKARQNQREIEQYIQSVKRLSEDFEMEE